MTYVLDKSFKDREITLTEPPFRLERTTWSRFEIEIRIKFHPKFKQDEVVLMHELFFEPGGYTQAKIIKVGKDLEDWCQTYKQVQTEYD